jgi:hypothetical protein
MTMTYLTFTKLIKYVYIKGCHYRTFRVRETIMKLLSNFVELEALTSVIGELTPCSPVEVYRRFGGQCTSVFRVDD